MRRAAWAMLVLFFGCSDGVSAPDAGAPLADASAALPDAGASHPDAAIADAAAPDAAPPPIGWARTDPAEVMMPARDCQHASIATDGLNSLYFLAGCEGADRASRTAGPVVLARSDDRGVTISAARVLPVERAVSAAITTTGTGTLHLATLSAEGVVRYARSFDRGDSWTEERTLGQFESTPMRVHVATDGEHVYVLGAGAFHLLFWRADAGGAGPFVERALEGWGCASLHVVPETGEVLVPSSVDDDAILFSSLDHGLSFTETRVLGRCFAGFARSDLEFIGAEMRDAGRPYFFRSVSRSTLESTRLADFEPRYAGPLSHLIFDDGTVVTTAVRDYFLNGAPAPNPNVMLLTLRPGSSLMTETVLYRQRWHNNGFRLDNDLVRIPAAPLFAMAWFAEGKSWIQVVDAPGN